MSAKVLTFFNNKGGVGKTSLVYHLAWMYAHLRKRVVILDLDPQANLTAAFLNEEKIDNIWEQPATGSTVYECVKPITGMADIAEPLLQNITRDLYLLPGDIRLSGFEETLSNEWPGSMGDNNLYRPLRILTSFWQIMQMSVKKVEADIVLIDIGPNLGAINRSVLIATDFVAIPLGTDLFSLQGLINLGPILHSWRSLWKKRLDNWEENVESKEFPEFKLPGGKMEPIGYLCQQYSVRLERPVIAYDKWAQRFPGVYREYVTREPVPGNLKQQEDPYCLATIKHYRSLVPMAREHRKPIFYLSPADGAIGSHANAVQDAKKDFRELATKIGKKIGLTF